MWKIIKSHLEQVSIKEENFLLEMKWQFKIEFTNDSFGPYDYKFAREDCYFIDGINDRGSAKFPLKNRQFQNTEIFLENDDIIICTWERGWLINENQTFIDIINLKTEKKQRLYTSQVNLIYNEEKVILINAKIWKDFKTIKFDIETLEIKEEIYEELQAFFKCVYKKTQNKWYLLDFQKTWGWWNDGYFELKKLDIVGEPTIFYREFFKVNDDIDVWELSCQDINIKNSDSLATHYLSII